LLADLEHLLESGSPAERAAAVLALHSAQVPEAGRLLERHAAIRDIVMARGVDWKSVLEFN
jgi:hypothetical protein